MPNQDSIDEHAKRKRVTTGAEMMYITGKSKTCDVFIGRLITIKIKDIELGKYRVYKTTHIIDEEDRYSCFFEAIPADLKHIPIPSVPIPTPNPIECEVVDNEDDGGMGRVLVKFPFDKEPCTTWMPVMSPDAGNGSQDTTSNAVKNRGYIWVPEKNDHVIVSFLDAQWLSQPYIMGSLFHRDNAVNQGGGTGNHIKTIRDKSGTEIIFDDAAGSLKIFSPKGQSVFFIDGGGNISLSTPNTITLSAKDIVLATANKIKMDSLPGTVAIVNAVAAAAGALPDDGLLEIRTKKKISIISDEEDISITAKKNIEMESQDAEIKIKAKTNIKMEAPTQLEIKTPDMQVLH